MKKIPTMFERDWEGDRSRVMDRPHPYCGWVFAGEGVATRKMDGTCCMVRGNRLFKRRELRKGELVPANFEETDFDSETGKTVGWLPIGEGPEDRWHREAFALGTSWKDGTYELIGPKIQGNPESAPSHWLVSHAATPDLSDDPPRSFDALANWLADQNIEGIVFHHPDGRMAKIKLRDFGLKRKSKLEETV